MPKYNHDSQQTHIRNRKFFLPNFYLDLKDRDPDLMRNTLSCGQHLCQFFQKKSFDKWQSYKPDTKYGWPLSVTLTLEVLSCEFYLMHWLNLVNICAYIFGNPYIQDKVTAWTLPWPHYINTVKKCCIFFSAKFDLDLKGKDLKFMCNTSVLRTKYQTPLMYDKVTEQTWNNDDL